jgi:hypothetical protein
VIIKYHLMLSPICGSWLSIFSSKRKKLSSIDYFIMSKLQPKGAGSPPLLSSKIKEIGRYQYMLFSTLLY